MITYGFVPSYGDVATAGSPFTSNGVKCVSYYLNIGSGGDLVWMNAEGQLQFSPNLNTGQEYVIGATQILSSGTVNGVSRSTTASEISWRGGSLYNTP